MRSLLLCFPVIFYFSISAQSIVKTRKVVPLYTQQDFFLNGGLRGNFGGKSRATYQVTLPPGTVEWYYTVTTAAGTPNQSLNLLPQLTKLMDPTGITSILSSAILAPTGSNAIDCLLMPTQYENAFMQMSDIASIPRFPPDSRLNFRSGTIQVRDIILPGSYSIGFRNPSASTGIGVSFEAAAIVEETTTNPDGEKAINYGNLGWKAFENGDISKCIEYSKKALALDNTLGYVKANLGLCYLVQNDETTATEYYIEALSDIKKMSNKVDRSVTLNAVLRDINTVLKKQPVLKGSDEIRSMYKNEVLKSFLN